MALDFYVVRFRPYPAEVHRYDWLIILFPIVPAILLVALAKTRTLHLDIGLGIASWFFGLLLAVPLIATVGVWFHFGIGGKL